MGEDSEHPGYIEYGHPNFESYLELKRKGRKFDDFAPFIQTSSMDLKVANGFKNFLKEFYEKTKDEWEPGGCRDIPDLLNTANKVLDKAILNGKIAAKRFVRSHFWLEIELENGQKLIVDPSGIPKDPNNTDRRHILPYFGPIDSASEHAKKIYEYGTDMDDWGTRDLPPGFHP